MNVLSKCHGYQSVTVYIEIQNKWPDVKFAKQVIDGPLQFSTVMSSTKTAVDILQVKCT